MDEQEIEIQDRVNDLKRRIEIMKQQIGYYQKGKEICSKESQTEQEQSLNSLRASIMRSGLE